jgi:RND family efflux transporter MFP subunit
MKTGKTLIALIVIISTGCANQGPAPVVDEVVRVRVAELLEGNYIIPVHATGILASSEELKLSFKTGGIVAKIYVQEGDRVKKGDLLASLNLSEISANADQARNIYEKALRDFSRAENLYRDSVTTLEQKQNAATALKLAKSSLDIVQFNLEHSEIKAPDDGLILRQLVEQSELVSSGYPVFLFGTSGKNWKIKSGISDRDVIKINAGDSASVSFDAYPGVNFPAVVYQVGEVSNPYTGTYEVELLLSSTDRRLASGFIATVNLFPYLTDSCTTIPVGSIVEADGQYGFIFTVTDDMTVKKEKIEIKSITGARAIVKGIPGGITEVVSEGAAYLKDGMKVKVEK